MYLNNYTFGGQYC